MSQISQPTSTPERAQTAWEADRHSPSDPFHHFDTTYPGVLEDVCSQVRDDTDHIMSTESADRFSPHSSPHSATTVWTGTQSKVLETARIVALIGSGPLLGPYANAETRSGDTNQKVRKLNTINIQSHSKLSKIDQRKLLQLRFKFYLDVPSTDSDLKSGTKHDLRGQAKTTKVLFSRYEELIISRRREEMRRKLKRKASTDEADEESKCFRPFPSST